MRIPNQTIVFIALFISMCMSAHAAETPNWQVTQGMDTLTQQQTPCLIESVSQTVDDGRTTTPMSIVYDGKTFLFKSRSKIDMTYPELGLHVDSKPAHKIDRVYKETNVVFGGEADNIREQFIKGLNAYIALGFWPTWPKSKTIVTRFSLIGFHAAYRDYLSCLKSHPSTNGQQ